MVLMIGIFTVGTVLVLSQAFRIDGRYTYRNSARSQIEMLSGAVELFVLAIGACPTNKQGLDALMTAPADLADKAKWQGPYLDKQQLPVDPWNNPYQYKAVNQTEYRIWSNGPDGVAGSTDDITISL